MNKKVLTVALVIAIVFLLASYSKTRYPSPTSVENGELEGSPTPTLSEGDTLEAIEADLNATLIMDEDFSNIE